MESNTNGPYRSSETAPQVSEPEMLNLPNDYSSTGIWGHLAALAKALAADSAPAQIAEAAVRQGVVALGARGGSLALLQDGDSQLRLLYSSGYSPEVIESWRDFPLQSPTIIAEAVRRGDAVFFSSRGDAENKGLCVGPVASVGDAFAALPLIAAGRVLGAVGFSFSESRRFSSAEKAFLTTLAQMAALALHSATRRDTVTRQRIEDALRAQETQLSLIANTAPIQITHIGPDERYLFVNRSYAAFRDLTPEEVVGKHPREVLGEDVYAAIAPYMKRALAGEEVLYEALLELNVIGPRYYRVHYMPDRADDGTVRGYVATIQDIHEQTIAAERIQAALQEKEDTLARLNSLVMAAPLGIAFFDREMRYLLINEPLAEMNGISLADHIGHSVAELLPSLYPTIAPVFRQVVEEGISFLNKEVSGETPKSPGVRRYWLESWYPVRDANGNVVGGGVIVSEVTEQKRQQAEIATLNARLRQAMTETHHRVKNNLQVIAAMIDLQTLSGRAMLPLAEFQRLGLHLRTLADVHDILTEHAKVDGMAGVVSARVVLGRLLAMLQSINREHHLRYTLEDGFVTSRQATSLSIITNELASNAIKHGRTTVDISFRVHEGVGVLTVEDDGPGFPASFDPVQASNTGLELVLNLTGWDMHGEIRFENREQGGGRAILTFLLTVPVGP